MNQALKQYRQIGAASGIQDADPHRLVQMLFQGALDRLHTARGCLRNRDLAGKGVNIGKAIRIVAGLRECLDFEAGEVAASLDALYDYMVQRLLECSAGNDETGLDEVIQLLLPLKEAWDGIRPQALKTESQPDSAAV